MTTNFSSRVSIIPRRKQSAQAVNPEINGLDVSFDDTEIYIKHNFYSMVEPGIVTPQNAGKGYIQKHNIRWELYSDDESLTINGLSLSGDQVYKKPADNPCQFAFYTKGQSACFLDLIIRKDDLNEKVVLVAVAGPSLTACDRRYINITSNKIYNKCALGRSIQRWNDITVCIYIKYLYIKN